VFHCSSQCRARGRKCSLGLNLLGFSLPVVLAVIQCHYDSLEKGIAICDWVALSAIENGIPIWIQPGWRPYIIFEASWVRFCDYFAMFLWSVSEFAGAVSF